MAKLHFDLVSPDRRLLSEEVDQVTAPGIEGEFTVLPDHAPMMTALAPGVVVVVTNGEARRIFVAGGFAEITPNGLTILAEEAAPADELAGDALAAKIEAAEAELTNAGADEARFLAERKIDALRRLAA